MQAENDNLQVTYIPAIELHADDDFNCRGEIRPVDVVDLARDIGERGLQAPIIVQPYSEEKVTQYGKKYRIVAGYRRHMAMVSVLMWDKIPCIIRHDLTDVDARILNLGENLHRQALNIVQEAKALHNLKLAGVGQEDVARLLQQSRGWVQVRYMLLDLPPEIQREAAAGLLNQVQIRSLYSLTSKEEQFAAVRAIKDAKLRGEKTPKIKTKPRSYLAKKQREKEEIFEMMDHIQEYIGNNFGTRCLAWAAGELSDLDLFRDIKHLADEEGINYEVPREALQSAM